MRSSRKKWPGAWIGIVLASSFLLVGAMKMSAYAEPAESTETAEITESSTGAGLSDMDFGNGRWADRAGSIRSGIRFWV